MKSKEDILIAVTERMTEESNQMLTAIRDRTDLNGEEKLKAIFNANRIVALPNSEMICPIITNVKSFENNFCFIFSHDTIGEVAPNYIAPIIKQCISDGSIQSAQAAGWIF